MVRDSSFYYLLGYTSTQTGADGKFHQITVRVKRRDVDVRARKGFWALTTADVEKIRNPTPDVAKPVQTALASIATSVQAGKYVRTWIGTERGENGKTRVTLIWEPLPQATGARRRDSPGACRCSPRRPPVISSSAAALPMLRWHPRLRPRRPTTPELWPAARRRAPWRRRRSDWCSTRRRERSSCA